MFFFLYPELSFRSVFSFFLVFFFFSLESDSSFFSFVESSFLFSFTIGRTSNLTAYLVIPALKCVSLADRRE